MAIKASDTITLVKVEDGTNAGRNLLLKSGAQVTTSAYNIQDYYFGKEVPQHDDEVTITIKATLGAGKAYFGIYNSGGAVSPVSIVPSDFKNGIAQKTFKWAVTGTGYTASNTFLRVYHMSSTTVVESTIYWIRLDFGTLIPNTWTPAPEDLEGEIEDTKKTVTTLSSSFTVLKNEINQTVKEATTITVDGKEKQVKEVTQSLVATVSGLENKLVTTGGDNLIRDSFGLFGDGFWIGKYNVDATAEVKTRNMYGAGLLLTKNELKQNVNVRKGTYTISFTYIKRLALANVKIIINGKEIILASTTFTVLEHTFEATNDIEIKFVSDTDNACTIINLMLNQGTTASVWSLNGNETYGDVVKIGRGIEIGADGIDVTFNANADIIGFKNKTTGEYVSIFTDVGMQSKEIVVTNKANIVKLLIQDIGGQTTINRIGGSG